MENSHSTKVPNGFLPLTADEVNPEGKGPATFIADLEANLDRIDCNLYTDRHGTNYFVIKVDGKRYCLPVRTD